MEQKRDSEIILVNNKGYDFKNMNLWKDAFQAIRDSQTKYKIWCTIHVENIKQKIPNKLIMALN